MRTSLQKPYLVKLSEITISEMALRLAQVNNYLLLQKLALNIVMMSIKAFQRQITGVY
jgi:hypothetical protein